MRLSHWTASHSRQFWVFQAYCVDSLSCRLDTTQFGYSFPSSWLFPLLFPQSSWGCLNANFVELLLSFPCHNGKTKYDVINGCKCSNECDSCIKASTETFCSSVVLSPLSFCETLCWKVTSMGFCLMQTPSTEAGRRVQKGELCLVNAMEKKHSTKEGQAGKNYWKRTGRWKRRKK